MKKRNILLCNGLALLGATSCWAQATVLYQDDFDGDSLSANSNGVGGGAVSKSIAGHSWTDNGDATFVTSGTAATQRALLYSSNAFQSDTGFRLTVEYTTGSVADTGSHNLSFGLVSDDTDFSSYTGFNPFATESNLHSLGANITADDGGTSQGLIFADGSNVGVLDQAGTRAQFVAGETCKVFIEIGIGGSWQYRINDEYEASGVVHDQLELNNVDFDGFDPSKSYRVVVYGQDDNGGGKSIQSIKLEKAPAAGERADGLRGTWTSGVDASLIDDRLKALKTLDGFLVRFSDGASLSAEHFAPNKFMETIAVAAGIDYIVAPSWGDLSLDEPEEDAIMDQLIDITSAGFKVKAYSNSEQFVGTNASQYQEFVNAWKAYCDTNTEVQDFIDSQPYHTGVWDANTQTYVDATSTYPDRKYMFCYAEYVLKEHSLRYGKYIGSWTFDSAKEMVAQGDNATSGLIEEQRIYQAFSDACRVGNPDIPLAYNNGRSTFGYNSYPFAHAKQFEDFTFGHAFGGNGDHASKTGSTFANNYKHVERMTATDGNVHDGGAWDWDDNIVGNFHSKLSTTSWKYGPAQAWEQADFNQWNLEAMQAGGAMLWDGSYDRGITSIYAWVYDLLEGTDAYLMEHESPGAPNWARYATILPDGEAGIAYSRIIVEDDDFWDPEGHTVTLSLIGAPSWLSLNSLGGGDWELAGVPSQSGTTTYEFQLSAADNSGSNERTVKLKVTGSAGNPEPQGLVAQWGLDDGSGSVASDGSGNGHNGTIVGAAWVSGRDGNALDFDGSASSVSLPASAFSGLSDEISIAMWVNGDLANPAANSVFYAADSAGNRLLNIHLPWSNGNVYWDAGNGSGFNRIQKGATSSEYEGSWHHWVFTKNASTGHMSIYLDGALWHTGSGNTTSIGSVAAASFGSNLGTNSYNGAIDDVQLYDLALTASEVQDLFESYEDPNQTPVALSDSASTDEDSSGAITLAGSDADGDPLTYNVESQPSNGTLSGSAPNLTYTPDANFNGSDSFTFTVNDGTESSAAATISITVVPVNDAPEAQSDSVSTAEDTSVAITLLGTDIDGDSLSFNIASQPSNGTLSGSAPNLSYTPDANYYGSDSFTFTVNDGTVSSAAATVSITVTPINDDPVFASDPIVGASATADSSYSGSIAGSAGDDDGDSLVYSKVNGPAWLNVSSSGALSGTPGSGDVGANSWTVQVSDGNGGTDTVSLQISVGATQALGLVAHWALDDGSGTVASDVSGNGHAGAIVSASWIAGIDGSALDFDGSASSVTLPTSAFSSVSGAVTIAMWVNGDLANPQSNSVFYAQDSNGSRLLNIHLPWSNGNVYWDAGSGTGYDRIQKSATAAEYEGAWHHWVFTKDASSGVMNIYLNGTLWHTGSGNTSSIGSVAAATFGSNITTNSYNGAIDDVLLYNVALSGTEVEDLYLAYAENEFGEFTDQGDIGSPSAAGTASYDSGEYTIEGSGADIWSTSDSFNFVSADQTGDVEIIARVASVENTHSWAKAGVMIRDSLAADSMNVTVVSRPNNQITMQWRSANGATSVNSGVAGTAGVVKWIRLVRSGNSFSGYYSTDAISWTLLSTQSVPMAASSKVGLAVTSHSDGALCSAIFDNVSVD